MIVVSSSPDADNLGYRPALLVIYMKVVAISRSWGSQCGAARPKLTSHAPPFHFVTFVEISNELAGSCTWPISATLAKPTENTGTTSVALASCLLRCSQSSATVNQQ